MSYGSHKRRITDGEEELSTVKKRLPAYKRQPDLYFSHVWLDREIYSQVLAFIGWERQKRYSIKMAVRILLELGLQHYVINQINMTTRDQQVAKMKGREPPASTDFVKNIRKRSRKMGLSPMV